MLRINAKQVHVDFNTTSLRAGKVELEAGEVEVSRSSAGYGGEYVNATLPLRAVVVGTDVPATAYPDPPVVIHSNAHQLRTLCEDVLEQLAVAGV